MAKMDLKETLASFDTLMLVKVDPSENIHKSPFQFLSGQFSSFGYENIVDFNSLIKAIYRGSPICEGIGYYEYCNQIKESAYFCMIEGKNSSFILPLRTNHSEKTDYFLMNMNKKGESIYLLFVLFDEKAGFYSIEEFSSGTFKDELTGLFNYRTLVTHIKDNKRKGYLVLYDLNKFKYINDTFGHEVGDDVLKLVGDYLISISSMNEVFYRRSGDEFVILFFEMGEDYVLKLINQIEGFLETIPAKLNKDFTCSAAFGVLELTVPEEDELELSYETKSKLIDLAMYQAKNAHKRYHIIRHEDAINIIKKGDLDERIDAAAALLKR